MLNYVPLSQWDLEWSQMGKYVIVNDEHKIRENQTLEVEVMHFGGRNGKYIVVYEYTYIELVKYIIDK